MDKPLRIVIVSAFYSEGMGYTENCLARSLGRLGHDVHVVSSTLNVYGNEPELYDRTYREFLGPAEAPAGVTRSDGYTVHRLPPKLIKGYVAIDGLASVVRDLQPDIVHSLEIASLPTFSLAAQRPFARFHLFCDTHQTLSSMKPYMRQPHGPWLKRIGYRLTRTLPSALAALAIDRVYAVTADCGVVANRYYGVPQSKITVLSLGSDTELFHPAESPDDRADRAALREALGFLPNDIVCVYSGRFSEEKNPLVLARAIDELAASGEPYKGLFIGNGAQRQAILDCRNTRVVPFMVHRELARHYRASEIAVWPRMESMSVLDAASSGIPVVVSDQIGDRNRIEGNGLQYAENDVQSMKTILRQLSDSARREQLGSVGRRRMVEGFSWMRFARTVEADYRASMR